MSGRTCDICAGPLPAGVTKRRRYCSDRCRATAWNRAAAERRAAERAEAAAAAVAAGEAQGATLGERLRAARVRLGLSQLAAARAVGVSHSHWWDWEHDRRRPCVARARIIEGRLRCGGIVALAALPRGVEKTRRALERPKAGYLPFGRQLRLERCRLGLTARELAERIGIDRSTVTAWERGRCLPHDEEWVTWVDEVLGSELTGAWVQTRHRRAQAAARRKS